MNRIKGEAENILRYERDLIEMPGGLPSLATIDAARIKLQVEGELTGWTCTCRLTLHDFWWGYRVIYLSY
jgi:hypothetical protein